MRLVLLTTLTMIAFAANSVLNRVAVETGAADAVSFAVLRVVSGALALAVLSGVQGRGFALGGPRRMVAALALLAYLFGFSLAYQSLDAGLGALILFGVVQITMFGGALAGREAVPPQRWLGALVAFGGLIWLLWPGGQTAISTPHAGLMIAAGFGWGIYSLTGQAEGDATQATTMNFLLAAPLAGLLWLVMGADGQVSALGIVWALLSGIVTSGLGYALWYVVLPSLGATRAALAQLSVPVIAIFAGVILLAEVVDLRLILATVLVLGGVCLGLVSRR